MTLGRFSLNNEYEYHIFDIFKAGFHDVSCTSSGARFLPSARLEKHRWQTCDDTVD